MTKSEFLAAVRNELGFLPQSEVSAAVNYFESYFTGTESDEDVTARLGSPHIAARNYYTGTVLPRMNQEHDALMGAAQNTAQESAQPPAKRNSIWLIVVILVLLSPILIPLAILIGCLALSFVAVIIGIYFALLFGGISIWFGGAAVVIKGLFSHIGFANTIMQCGIGFFMFGLGLALTLLAVFIAVKLIPWFIRKIVDFGSKRVRRREA